MAYIRSFDPIVTVGIPVFRPRIDLLRKCLRSIEKQSCPRVPIEILLVADGVQENEEIVSGGFLRDFPYVRLVVEEHKGCAETRNTIIRKARGKWIAFVDADDSLTNSALSHLLEAGESSTSDIVFSNHFRQYRDHTDEIKYFESTCDWNGSECAEVLGIVLSPGSDQGTVWGKLFNRDFLTSKELLFNSHLENGEDQEFLTRCVVAAEKITAIPNSTYNYLYNAASKVRSFSKRYGDELEKTLDFVLKDLLPVRDKVIQLDTIYQKYVLDRFLMYCINYLGHPSYLGTYFDKKRDFNNTIARAPYAEALQASNIKEFSAARRIVLFFAKHHLFAPIYIISRLRQLSLSFG